MQLIVSPAQNGRHHVHLADRLLATSDYPLFAAALTLLGEGVPRTELLEVFHEGSRQPVLCSTVGAASRPPVPDDGLGLQSRHTDIFQHAR